MRLWFDVGIVRYTTSILMGIRQRKLWFDVGIVRYTTFNWAGITLFSCGLM